MAITYGILGQTADASIEATLYTVPVGRAAKFYVTIVNRSTAATFRAAHILGGGATTNEDYFAYDEEILANQSLTSEVRTASAGDVIRAHTSTANITVQVYGIEVDQ